MKKKVDDMNKFELEMFIREVNAEGYEDAQATEIEKMLDSLIETNLKGYSFPEVEVRKFSRLVEIIREKIDVCVEDTSEHLRINLHVYLSFPAQWLKKLIMSLKKNGYNVLVSPIGSKSVELIITGRKDEDKDGMETNNESGDNKLSVS